MTTFLAFAAGLTWGVSVTILWFWATNPPPPTLDRVWSDNAELFEDDE
jgi:hypothetical protein